MNLDRVTPGDRIPDEINVVVEIPAHSEPVKYEVDKATGAMFVDRFMSTAMRYPCNYGYIPHSLSPDGDPLDVLIVTPAPVISGAVVRCRPIGVLRMTDEKGGDAKVLAVPIDRLCALYRHVAAPQDMPEMLLAQIAHFFAHYKDLEPNRWARVEGWSGSAEAKAEIAADIERYRNAREKPFF